MMEQEKKIEDICLNCNKFKKASKELLDKSDSVYDAVSDAINFTKECKKTCVKYQTKF